MTPTCDHCPHERHAGPCMPRLGGCPCYIHPSELVESSVKAKPDPLAIETQKQTEALESIARSLESLSKTGLIIAALLSHGGNLAAAAEVQLEEAFNLPSHRGEKVATSLRGVIKLMEQSGLTNPSTRRDESSSGR